MRIWLGFREAILYQKRSFFYIECGDMISSLEIGFDPVGGDSDGQRSFPRPLDLTRFWSKITYFVL